MSEEKIREKIEKLYHAIAEEIEKLTRTKRTREDFKPSGIVIFVFSDEKTGVIAAGKISVFEIMDHLAEICPDIVRGLMPATLLEPCQTRYIN